MKDLWRIGMMGVVFTLGCFTASVVQQIAVPSLKVGSTATKWEQTCVNYESQGLETSGAWTGKLGDPTIKGWVDVIQEWGAQGWELVQTEAAGDGYFVVYVCFKRPM
ncbi:MAG: hypothetical protein VYA34_09455 [Myxococcota bacterium]|nr:hypothetical protein [Myxococcota bacterium]